MPDYSLRVPIVCPVCGGVMRGNKSTSTWYDYQCCADCFIFWLDGRPEKIQKWKDGWRPDEAEVDRMWKFMKTPE